MMRCMWCGMPQPPEALRPAGLHGIHGPGYQRCRDGVSCAQRAGELMWGAYPGHADPPGRYCCVDVRCSHPREQVFNGGGG